MPTATKAAVWPETLLTHINAENALLCEEVTTSFNHGRHESYRKTEREVNEGLRELEARSLVSAYMREGRRWYFKR